MRTQFTAHVTPLLEQLFLLQENGLLTELLMELPPKLVDFDNDTDLPASAAFASQPVAAGQESHTRIRISVTPKGNDPDYPYEARVSGVRLNICLNVHMDGGTWGAASGKGARIIDEQNCFLDDMNREEHQKPMEVVWLKNGECLRTISKDDVSFKLNCVANDKSMAGALNKLTRTPQRVVRMNEAGAAQPGAADAFASHGDDEQQQLEAERVAAAQEQNLRGPGGKEATEYADPELNRIKYTPETYFSTTEVDGSNEEGYGVTTPVREKTLVRVLCTATSRTLDHPAWKELPVEKYCAICILHDAMRTGEKLFECILAPLLDLYRGGQRAAVDKYLNPCLVRMKIRRIALNREAAGSRANETYLAIHIFKHVYLPLFMRKYLQFILTYTQIDQTIYIGR